MKKLMMICMVVVLYIVPVVNANTIESSSMHFQGALTDNGDGAHSGVLRMLDEAAEGIGDGVSGYDIYAKEGDAAWFGDVQSDPVWSSVTIADHDAWSDWNPDTPDWYQYSLSFYAEDGQQKWAVRNHPGATEDHPWYDTDFWGTEKPAMGVPMSGLMSWCLLYATETGTGAYLPGTGIPEIAGGAAEHGGGPGAWDMDWSWGSEAVPLELPGFLVEIEGMGGGEFKVTLTPALPSEVWVDDDFDSSTQGWGITHFDNIQDALDSVGDGDTIIVKPGEYSGVTVTKAVEIRGEGGVVINDGPAYSRFITGFYFRDGAGNGTTISHLSFETVDLAIYSRDTDDVTIEYCTMSSPVQGITNWNGDGWNINHNVISGLRTSNGGGLGIFIGTRDEEGRTANNNLISHNKVTGEVVVPQEEIDAYDDLPPYPEAGYSVAGICLMSDRRSGRPAGPITENRILKNKVAISSNNPRNHPAEGIALSDLGLDEDPPVPDIADNKVAFNDVRGVTGESSVPIALSPAEVAENNEIERNLGYDIPNYGEGFEVYPSLLAPFGPPE
ncbi:MAG: hypothetical protein JSW23_04920 [Planctomycetota bacterium]|nr:MAG: hypothetical protein JSW23_04920 [Planctomycetota bacterium]